MDARQVEMWVEAATNGPMRAGTVVQSNSSGRRGMVVSVAEMTEVMFKVRWFDGGQPGIMKASEISTVN